MMRLPRFRHLLAHPLAALVVVLGLATLSEVGTAEAGHVRFSGGARFSGRWHGGVSVRFGRPAWRPRRWFGGSVWIGTYYYPRPYYYYYPQAEYVPSYYGGSYYPVQPSAAPGLVVSAPPRRSLPVFGLGVAAGGSSVQDQQESSDLSALARFRLTPGLILEGEIGKTSFKDDIRVDRRIGGTLLWEIGAYNTLAPYLLAGGGVQQAEVDGSFTTTQEFGEAGIGLRWALSRNLHLTFDVRGGRRKAIGTDGNQVIPTAARSVAPPSSPNNDTEDFTRGRLAAILYF